MRMPGRSETVFDPGPLEEFASRAQIAEILDAFTEHCDRALPELAAAVRDRRRDAIDRAAHALAGSSGTVGAPGVAAEARTLCALARGDAGPATDGPGSDGPGSDGLGPDGPGSGRLGSDEPGSDGLAFDAALGRLLAAAADARAAIERYLAGRD